MKRLSEQRRADSARTLFNVKSEQGDELHGLCPFHDDHNASFSYNSKKDLFNCFTCGATGNLVALWCHANGHPDDQSGYRAFCAALGLTKGKHTAGDRKAPPRAPQGAEKYNTPTGDQTDSGNTITLMNQAWEAFPLLPSERIETLIKSRGWTREMIEILDLRLQTQYLYDGKLIPINNPDKQRIAISVRAASGELLNLRLYLPGAKQAKMLSFATGTGSSALFPALPAPEGTIWLCEGESDTICALSRGLNAITQTAKISQWAAKQLSPFRGRDVIIAYDNDDAGRKYAAEAVANLLPVAKSVRVINWDGTQLTNTEDLTDWFVKYRGTVDGLIALACNAPAQAPVPPISVLKNNPAEKKSFYNTGANGRYSFRPRLLAEEMIADNRYLYDPHTGIIYRWNERFWEEYPEDNMRAQALGLLGDEAQRYRVEDAVFQAQMLSIIPDGRKVNDKIEWLCLQNCMFNIATQESVPHSKDFYATFALPVAHDPTARAPRWELFLSEVLIPEEQSNDDIRQSWDVGAQLQEFFGYALMRHTKYQKCLFLLGPGADGKSTLLKVLRAMLGAENTSAVSFDALEDHFARAALYNKLLNTSSEVGNKAMQSQFFKDIVSGDAIQAAFKHENFFEFYPYCKMAFAGNQLPRVLDNSDGFFRRFMPIEFKRQFLEGNKKRDTNLLDTLLLELDGIFLWALKGAKRLQEQNGFTVAQATQDLLRRYQRYNNPVMCFVEDRCEMGSELSVSKNDLYTAYKSYCGESGFSPLHRENFFRELQGAVKTITAYRPRVDGARELHVRGLNVKYIPEY